MELNPGKTGKASAQAGWWEALTSGGDPERAREPRPGPRLRGSLHSLALRRPGERAESRQGGPQRQERGWSLEQRRQTPDSFLSPASHHGPEAVAFEVRAETGRNRGNIPVNLSLGFFFFFFFRNVPHRSERNGASAIFQET